MTSPKPKRKKRVYKVKGWVVVGNYGETIACVKRFRAENEKERILALGQRASIFPCVITYTL